MPKTPPTERKSTDQPGGHAERLLERVRRPSTPKRPSITKFSFEEPIGIVNVPNPEVPSSKDEAPTSLDETSSSDSNLLTLSESTIHTTLVKQPPRPKAQSVPTPPTPPERFTSFDAWIKAIKEECETLRASCNKIIELENDFKEKENEINRFIEQLKKFSPTITVKAAVRYKEHQSEIQTQTIDTNARPSPFDSLINSLKVHTNHETELQNKQQQLTALEQKLDEKKLQLMRFGLQVDATIPDINKLENNSLRFINALRTKDESTTQLMLSNPNEPFHPDIIEGSYKFWLLPRNNNWQTRLSRSTSQEELAENTKPVRRVTYPESAQPPSTQEAPKKSAFYL